MAKNMIDEFLDDFFMSSVSDIKSDVLVNDSEYKFLIELAGFKKEEIKIDYNDGYLTVSAKHISNEDSNHRYLRKERIDNVERSFYVEDIDDYLIKAKLENGILSIIVPKKVKTALKDNKICWE